jgi:hypothetical protein
VDADVERVAGSTWRRGAAWPEKSVRLPARPLAHDASCGYASLGVEEVAFRMSSRLCRDNLLLDVRTDFVAHLPELLQTFLIRAGGPRGVLERPVQTVLRPGKDRTGSLASSQTVITYSKRALR